MRISDWSSDVCSSDLVLFEGHHALLAPDHVARDVLVVQLGFELDEDLPGLRLVLGEVVLGVLDEQRVDVDDVTLDQQVVRPLPQLDQGARDDVYEGPGELPERGSTGKASCWEKVGNYV